MTPHKFGQLILPNFVTEFCPGVTIYLIPPPHPHPPPCASSMFGVMSLSLIKTIPNPGMKMGLYKSAVIAAPRRLLRHDVLIVKLEKFTAQNVSFYGRNRRAPQ